MTLTTIDTRSALLLVDLQKGVVTLPLTHPVPDVVANAVRLAGAFRARDLPVVLITVTGGAPGRTSVVRAGGAARPADWADIIPELDGHPSDHHIVKKTWGAFTSTGLDELLKRLGVTQAVIAGIATSIGVESTARQAYEHGYNVTLAVDAMTDYNPDAHENSTTRIFPRLGETGSTEEVLALLPAAGG